MKIMVCIGSSCHLKGSYEIVHLLQKEIADRHLEDQVTLGGSFCMGKCNRIGVSVQVDDAIYTGVTVDGFDDFFSDHILSAVSIKER